MIDTVVLTLAQGTYQITEPDKFTPSAKWVENLKGVRGIQSKQNPTKKELLKGIYKPRLTLANRIDASRRSEAILKIELSLPKLFFENNFDELKYKDFKSLTQKLVNVLKDMGVETTAAVITQAPVSVVHYSKNIPLTDGSIPYHFINKIKEANIKLSLDVNQTDYRNDGHSYKWHCNTYEVVFYDKIRDLEKAKQSDKRCLEKDSAIQLNIFDNLKTRHRLEFLRMEVRLNKRTKIKQLFKKLKINSDLTLKSIFKPAISKKILLHYLDELESKKLPLIDYKASDKVLISELITNNRDFPPKKIMQIFGLKKALEVYNLRELQILFDIKNKRSWLRLISEINKIKLSTNKTSFDIIHECITTFKAIKFKK